MVGRKMFGKVDRRLRQAFPHKAGQLLGGISCLLIGDWGQLPPVMDLPLYTTVSRTELSDLGSTAYHCFDRAVVLDQVMRQAGQGAEQQAFRDILLRLRNAHSTLEDWRCLMKRTPCEVVNVADFDDALHLYPTTEAVAEYNIGKLRSSGQPVALIKAVHTGPGAGSAAVDDAGGLEPVVCIAHGARIMLSANLWVEVGLVNGALGTVVAICYEDNHGPPDLPVAVMVRFDSYAGPTLSDGTVPIAPLHRTWFTTTKECSRLQLPLKLSWAVTIHKAQGMTLDKVVIDVGKKEFSSGLTFVACSRVRCLTDLLFVPPFAFQRLSNMSKSTRLQDRLKEDDRLLEMSKSLLAPRPENGSSGTLPIEEAMDCGKVKYPYEQMEESSVPSASLDVQEIIYADKAMDQGATPPGSPDLPPLFDSDDDVEYVPSTQPYICQLKYNPVDDEWQQRT